MPLHKQQIHIQHCICTKTELIEYLLVIPLKNPYYKLHSHNYVKKKKSKNIEPEISLYLMMISFFFCISLCLSNNPQANSSILQMRNYKRPCNQLTKELKTSPEEMHGCSYKVTMYCSVCLPLSKCIFLTFLVL